MDINALRDRLNKLNNKTSKGGDLWKPKDEHTCRLLRAPGNENPLPETYFHNDVGDEFPIYCPKMNDGDECKLCDFAELLKQWKNPEGQDKPEAERKADWEIFKKIQAKARVYVPMIERGADGEPTSDKAQWWSMTPNQAGQALEVCFDGDRLEELGIAKDDAERALNILFDPVKGYDINVSYAKPGEKGNNKSFTIITLKGRIKPSPLSKNETKAKAILASLKPFKDSGIITKTTPEEVEKHLKKFLNAGGSEAKADNGKDKEKYGEKPAAKAEEKAPSNTKENAKLSGTRTLDDAFGDMLADKK